MRMCIIYGQDEHIPHIFLIQLFYSYKDHQNDNPRGQRMWYLGHTEAVTYSGHEGRLVAQETWFRISHHYGLRSSMKHCFSL